MSTGNLILALELDGEGAHPSAWRAADHGPRAALGPRRLAQLIGRAEQHGFHAVTLDDGPLPPQDEPGLTGRVDAVLRAAFAAPLTSGIGLVPRSHTAFGEPFHLAGAIASLDHASFGRAGWLVGSSGSAQEGQAYGRAAIEDAAALREESSDVVRAARLLWDSWQDDAVIRDADSGRYLDRDRLHAIHFRGRDFSVRGPSITPRPPQGQAVVFAETGAIDPELIDVALIRGGSVEQVRVAAAAARDTGAPRVFAEVEVVLDAAGAPAAERLARLDALAETDGFGPWPDTGRLRFVGRHGELVQLLGELAGLVDGVRLHPAVTDVDAAELGWGVLPLLRSGGLAQPLRGGSTLRETLGLPRPTNRFESGTAQALHAFSALAEENEQ